MSYILVTGSEGTLGKMLCRTLMVRGHRVHGVDLQHTDSECDEYTRVDVRNYRQLKRVFEEMLPEYVYHLAAEFGRINGEEYYEQVWSTNMIGTRHVIELCHSYSSRLIFASSSEIYGEVNDDWIRETHDEGFIRPANDYAISKWANELQIMNCEQTFGLNAMRLRFFNAYGPGESYHPYRSVVCLFVNKALRGEPYTVYKGYKRVFMYVDDFIPTLANACENFLAGAVINIGGNDYRSVEELSDIVLAATDGDSNLVKYMDEDIHNTKSKRPEINAARKLLHHDPKVRLESGVREYVRWLIEKEGR